MTLSSSILLEHARRAYQQGDYFGARDLAQQVLTARKGDPHALHLLARVAFRVGDYSSAARHYKQCLSMQPGNPALHHEFAQTKMLQGDFKAALASLDRVLDLSSDAVTPLADKADVLDHLGNHDAAWAVLSPFLAAGTEHESMAVVAMRLLERRGQSAEAITLARRHLARDGIDTTSRLHLLRQVARLLEQAGDSAGAFEAFSDAWRSGAAPFNPHEYSQTFDTLMATFSSQNLPRLARSNSTSEQPVFIACMPRSGSTLVEQIIHAHPKAFGAGEIPHMDDIVRGMQMRIESFQTYPACLADLRQEHVDQLSRQYLDDTARMARGARRIANKNLSNYLHLGVVWLLFPRARVIHIKRDRLDNGFACFMAALNPAHFPWVTDLRNIGLAWRQYERLMDHWREVLDLPMLEVQYEELVDDTEAQIRRIIDFCGLEWDDRCLRYWEADRNVMTLSYDQVRRPIFKSAVKRYQKYEQFLGPLKEALEEGRDSA